jgi:FlaA1/EpsC-like NDP-sugar epimerase
MILPAVKRKTLLRSIIVLVFYAALVIASMFLATVFRYDSISSSLLNHLHRFFYIQGLVYTTCFLIFKLHLMPWRYTGVRMVIRIGLSCVLGIVLMLVLSKIFDWRVLRSILILTGVFTCIFIFGARYAWSVFRKLVLHNEDVIQKNVLIVGTGELGTRAFHLCYEGAFPVKGIRHVPVSFVDDDLDVVFRNVCGIPVDGGYADIPKIIEAKGIHEIILAVSGGAPVLLGQIVQLCMSMKHNIPIFVVAEKEGIRAESDSDRELRLRKLVISDLLVDGASPEDDKYIRALIQGRRVMVTGGAGSMGSELCQQIMRYNPEQLVVLDVNENYLFQTFDEASSTTRAKLAIVADSIVDQDRMEAVFSRYQPQIVFHAAGYKNRLVAENCAESAVRNNILGTQSVLRAAGKNRTRLFVHLSSDQAKDARTVMGTIKKVEEMSVQAHATSEMRCISVRFGNVLGAYGGVVSRLNTQIDHGGPVVVYDPDAKRCFMSVRAAANGMLKAASEAWAKPTEDVYQQYALDMGWPIRIRDLAEMLIRLRGFEPGKDIAIQLPNGKPSVKSAQPEADTETLKERVERDRVVRLPLTGIDPTRLQADLELVRMSLHNMSNQEIMKRIREIAGSPDVPLEPEPLHPEASPLALET